MKASELRIDNLVWNSVQKIAVKVDLKILSDQLYGVYPWDAIQLTEEWLIKFGFKDNPFLKNVLFIDGKIGLFNKDGVYSLANHEYNIVIKYVHQLQNLYFALTGEELTLKTEL